MSPEVLESGREPVYKGNPGASPDAGVVELADARDSKSRARKGVRVQVPPPAPGKQKGQGNSLTLFLRPPAAGISSDGNAILMKYFPNNEPDFPITIQTIYSNQRFISRQQNGTMWEKALPTENVSKE